MGFFSSFVAECLIPYITQIQILGFPLNDSRLVVKETETCCQWRCCAFLSSVRYPSSRTFDQASVSLSLWPLYIDMGPYLNLPAEIIFILLKFGVRKGSYRKRYSFLSAVSFTSLRWGRVSQRILWKNVSLSTEHERTAFLDSNITKRSVYPTEKLFLREEACALGDEVVDMEITQRILASCQGIKTLDLHNMVIPQVCFYSPGLECGSSSVSK